MKGGIGIKSHSKGYGEGIPVSFINKQFLSVLNAKTVNIAVEVLVVILVKELGQLVLCHTQRLAETGKSKVLIAIELFLRHHDIQLLSKIIQVKTVEV